MHSDETYRLLGYLYQIVPERKSAIEISKEVFNNGNNISVNELLTVLINGGYVYSWNNSPDDKSSFSMQEEYGMTVKGILLYDKYLVDKKTVFLVENKQEPEPELEKNDTPADTKIESVKEQDYSFRRAIPVIILIAFAIALIWFITHMKSKT